LGNLYRADGEHEAARRCMEIVVGLSERGLAGQSADAGEAEAVLIAAKAFLAAKAAAGENGHGQG
jgi:hypothetical protein